MQPREPLTDPASTARAGSVTGAGVTHQEADVNGIRMRWDECGSGVPVVLVHGLPTSARLWRHVMPRVEGARVIAWEMVGYGDSIPEGRGRDISVRAQAGYLLDWMQSQGIERAVLVGHDLGGGVVQIAAVSEPQRCLGLLLTNAIGYDSWPIPSVKVLRAGTGLARHMPAAMVKSGVLGMMMARGHDNDAMADESLEVHWAPYERFGAAESLLDQIDALDVDDTLAVADRISTLAGIPTRLLWGMDDPFLKPELGERFARDLGVALEPIEGGKHFTPEDNPERIAGAINSLIGEVADRTGRAGAPGH